MNLEIATAFKDTMRKEIVVDFENIDKSLSIHIPLHEFKSWCKENDKDTSTDNIEPFVREYLHGVINLDDTAQYMLKEIWAIFAAGKSSTYTFNCEKEWYTITTGRYGYRLFKGEYKQGNADVKEVYKAVMRSLNKPMCDN